MSANSYTNLFISEAREIMGQMNNGLVNLERHPGGMECLNEIFRNAHTLKANAAAMGYEEIAKLTHEMEEVLDLLRQGKRTVDKKTMQVLFHSCDVLEFLIKGIAAGPNKNTVKESLKTKASDLTQALSRMKGEKAEGKNTSGKEEGRPERRTHLRLESEDRIEIIDAAQEGRTAYRLTVTLLKGCLLKEPRALTVVKTLESLGKVVRAAYVSKELAEGRFGRHFGLFFITDRPPAAVQEAVKEIQDVETIHLKPLGPEEVEIPMGLNPKPQKPAEKKEEPIPHERPMVRVELDKLDRLMSTLGELVINKIRLLRIGQTLQDKALLAALSPLSRLTEDLQNEMMDARIIPTGTIFNQFPRMIRDLAEKEEKDIALEIEGAEIGLDRTILDEIHDPLVHLLRNAVSHGIEKPEIRKKSGKNPAGIIRLSARRERSVVVIEVRDDGQGMNQSQILEAAVRKKIVTREEAAALESEEILALITSPGFSMSEVISPISGRGVGMNSVKTKIESFGGALQIKSEPGKGSTFTLRLPLTMAIIQALLVGVENEIAALPFGNVVKALKIKPELIKKAGSCEVISFQNAVLPVTRLRNWLGFDRPASELRTELNSEKIPVVIVEVGNRKAGLIVDEFCGQQEVVIKPMKASMKNIKGVAGATILGNGKVAVVVDVAAVL